MLGNYRVAAQLVASRVVLSSTELVNYIIFVRFEVLFILLGFISLWLCYINIIMKILGITHRSVIYLKHDVSEIEFYICLQEESTQLGSESTVGLYPQPGEQMFLLSPKNKTNSMALSSQANYTDWATATCWRNLVPTFVDKGVSRGQRGGSPTAYYLHVSLKPSTLCGDHLQYERTVLAVLYLKYIHQTSNWWTRLHNPVPPPPHTSPHFTVCQEQLWMAQ
jgi:hypothetical protein